jgi:GT2 family glycosyltransferase
MPLVSIIIPCYNAARWLAETLESALAQTWLEKEIILVDDGSTDGSLELVRGYESRGVRVLRQSNRGAAAARNAGLAAARGDYLQFLDADDLLAPDKIAVQMKRLRASPPRHMASGAWARFRRDPREATFVPEPNWRDLSGLEFLLLHYEAGWMMLPAAWLCPRPLLDDAGPWNERLTLNDDGEYFGRVMLAAEGILFCEAACSFYRSGLRGSLSRRKDVAALRSLWLSTELNCGRMLAAAQDSPRARAAAASGWQRLAFESYPAAPDLAAAAERHAAHLGGSPFPMPAGPWFHRMARWTGWRFAKRLRDAWLRLRRV